MEQDRAELAPLNSKTTKQQEDNSNNDEPIIHNNTNDFGLPAATKTSARIRPYKFAVLIRPVPRIDVNSTMIRPPSDALHAGPILFSAPLLWKPLLGPEPFPESQRPWHHTATVTCASNAINNSKEKKSAVNDAREVRSIAQAVEEVQVVVRIALCLLVILVYNKDSWIVSDEMKMNKRAQPGLHTKELETLLLFVRECGQRRACSERR